MTAPGRTAYEDEMRNGLPEALCAQLLPEAENLAVALTEAVLADGLGFKGPFEDFGRIAEPLLLDALGAARRDGAQVANEASAQALARLQADLTAAEAEIASLRLRVREVEGGASASQTGLLPKGEAAEAEASQLRERVGKLEEAIADMREQCAREAERVVKVPARTIGGMRIERHPMAPRTPREIAAAIRSLPLDPSPQGEGGGA